jgi:DGQHR domain-containing protein
MDDHPNEITFDFLPIRQRGTTFYSVVIKASDLVRLCAGLTDQPAIEQEDTLREQLSKAEAEHVVTALSSPAFAKEALEFQEQSYDECEPYQRLIDFARARSIASYAKEPDALLPNGIILATKSDVDILEVSNEGRVRIKLIWSPLELPLNIIDGQHRVEGLKMLVQEKPEDFSAFEIPATLLIDLPLWIQAQLFAVINGRQKQVPASRVYDLLGYMPMQDPEIRKRAYMGEMALQRFCHHVVRILNKSSTSPWNDRIKMRGAGRGVVSQAALVDHLAIYLQPRKERVRMRTLPILYRYYKDSDVVGISKALIIYFLGIKQAKPQFWASDSDLKSSLFGKTNGIAVILQVMHDLAVTVGGADKLTSEFVREMWSRVPDSIITTPPKGGSKGFQAEVAQTIMSHICTGERTSSKSLQNKLLEELRKEGALFGSSFIEDPSDLLPTMAAPNN